jgi:hypothetical protein
MSVALQVIIPVACGIAFYFLGVALPDDMQGEVALGATGVLVAVVAEVIFRLAKREAARDATSALMTELDSLPTESYLLARELLVEYARATNSAEHPVYRDALRLRARESTQWLKRVSSGELEVEAQNIGLLEEGVKTSRRLIRGITVAAMDLEWWQSAPGARYWSENVKAIETRRVQIERIFIDGLGFQPSRMPELQQLMAIQSGKGVEVFFVATDQLADVGDAERDITIFDEQLVHEVSASLKGVPTRVTYRRGRDAVQLANGHFEKVLARARPIKP